MEGMSPYRKRLSKEASHLHGYITYTIEERSKINHFENLIFRHKIRVILYKLKILSKKDLRKEAWEHPHRNKKGITEWQQ